ncbi:winged helix-turn-helix transcriptional regulator [Paroceanicella profunda]|uniref:Winged helix-turn-helix transcriptional regulator n=1 Tax=Paroceanicella profunda TaxID=2579971 RepID=A0A5B8FH16_9RHOB|nr:MarR family winged helix-turn-helix transcriptional regulator [Paroceanicella profunda]QDL91891.1 winged helix-turn-helix transcriptional regulator [Paroceanicella profunda]
MDPDCTCFRVRRLARQISQIYDAALREAGLKGTQMTLLDTIRTRGPLCIAELADAVGAERSSITRALSPLAAEGWISIGQGCDGRTKAVRITDAGQARIALAEPLWAGAQAEVSRLLGQSGKTELDRMLDQASRLLHQAEDETAPP